MSLGVISMSDQEVESHIRRLMEEHMDKAQTKRENPLLERDSDNDDVVSEKPSFLRQITAIILYFFTQAHHDNQERVPCRDPHSDDGGRVHTGDPQDPIRKG